MRYLCNPRHDEQCEFRGKDRVCRWKDTCNQKVPANKEEVKKVE